MKWHPQLENGELTAAEEAGFEALIMSDQNIKYQQNLTVRKLALVVLGSDTWPAVSDYGRAIAAVVDRTMPGGYEFIEIPPPKRRGYGG